MPWQKSSDTAATHPKFMQIRAISGCDARTTNEVVGFLWRCSVLSAQHKTDYLVDLGTAEMVGGPRTPALVRVAKRAGLLSDVRIEGLRGYRLTDDEEIWHIRSRRELEWESQRKRDNSDPGLKVPVVLRDGDQCRWCGVLTQMRGRTSARTFTLDHLEPGQAGTVDTMVVACLRCNTSRQDNPRWDDDHQLRPAPGAPLYGKWSADYLTNNGYPTQQNVYDDGERPAPATASGTAPTSVRPARAAAADTAHRRDAQRGPGETQADLDIQSRSNDIAALPGVGPVGSGRDGSGTGRVGPGRGRRRGRRGRGGRVAGAEDLG